MQSATRLVPSFRQAFRPIAGPSRPALARFMATAAEAETSGTEGALPPNVTFEDLSGARAKVGEALLERGERLHINPEDPMAPIELPLSSLASVNPTAPATGAAAGTALLPPDVFGKPLRKDILHRNVVWYLSTLRAGNQSTKNRSTVAYSGKKIRPQKGSGKARVGDRSSGTRRGGAPIFALQPRDWAQDLPRKVRKLGLHTALSSKLSSGLLRVVSSLDEGGWGSTREAVQALADGMTDADASYTLRFGPKKNLSVLFIHSPTTAPERVEELWRVVRNVPGLEVLPADEVLTYDVLKYRWIVLEAGAVDALGADGLVYEFEGEDFGAQFETDLIGEPEVHHVDLDAAAPASSPAQPTA